MTTIPLPPRSVALKPLALPSEHGGWGILFEPIMLALLVAPTASGAFIALAAVFAFLARQPFKLAMQDLLKHKRYPRTPYCEAIAGAYLLGALLSLACGLKLGGVTIMIPFAIVAPFALIQLVYDARNRSRELIAELSGAAAMTSVAASIAIADGMTLTAALGLAGIIAARSLPSIVYVRALLRPVPGWPALAMHVVAVVIVAMYSSPFAIAAMAILLARAVWGLTHARPAARTIGWREIAFGLVTVLLAAAGVSM